jgi:glucose uptake protein
VFTVNDPGLAILFCVITMLGWGSWANTQKLAGRQRWPFELYYWDYAVGVALVGAIFFVTLGVSGSTGTGSFVNLQSASSAAIWRAIGSGALFNVANILVVIAIDAAGMAIAFPIGVGLALVIGTVFSYIQQPKGDPWLLGGGVALIVLAMIFSAVAHRKTQSGQQTNTHRAILFAVLGGCLMGFFYPQLTRSISPDFNTEPIQPGLLTPYTALLFFGIGLLASNFIVNTIFMRAQGSTFRQYLGAAPRLHSLGILGGIIWMLALCLNVIASGQAGPAVSYALGQGATLVAALWGVFIWHEFRGAPAVVRPLIGFMFAAYAAGLLCIGAAIL